MEQETGAPQMPSDQEIAVAVIAQQQIDIRKLQIANQNLAREARQFMAESRRLAAELEALKGRAEKPQPARKAKD